MNSFVDDSSPSQSYDPGFFLLKNIGPRIKRWLYGLQVHDAVEILAQELVVDSDLSVQLEESCSSSDGSLTPRQHKRYISELVDECKIAIEGVGVETQANRLVAQRWLSKRMSSRGMRVCHIKTILPIAVEMVFVQNEYEIIAHQLRSSRAILQRKALAAEKYTPRHRPTILNWLGAPRAQPRIVEG